jgi:hypothetical protein
MADSGRQYPPSQLPAHTLHLHIPTSPPAKHHQHPTTTTCVPCSVQLSAHSGRISARCLQLLLQRTPPSCWAAWAVVLGA